MGRKLASFHQLKWLVFVSLISLVKSKKSFVEIVLIVFQQSVGQFREHSGMIFLFDRV